MKKTFLLILLFVFITGCQNQSNKVNFKKPYLTEDRNGLNSYKAKITMHDYETKQTIPINTYHFKEILNVDGYNKYNDDNLFFPRYGCEILIVHRNSTSEIFDPCKIDEKLKTSSFAGVYFGPKNFVIIYNDGYHKKDLKNQEYYDEFYNIAIFTHDYKLEDVVHVNGSISAVAFTKDNIKYINYKELDQENKTDHYLVNYNLVHKIETGRIKFDNKLAVNSMMIINNNLVYTADQTNLYLDQLNNIKSKKKLTLKNQNLVIANNSLYYQDNNQNKVIPINNNNGYNIYRLKMNNNKIWLEEDKVCQGLNQRYTTQGQYCINKKGNRVIFQDFKNKPQELTIKIGEGKDEYYAFSFYDWH